MKKKIIISLIVVVVVGGIAYANLAFKRAPGVSVNTEKIEKRDLESIVTASGKIQPKKSVNISAETSGKVVALNVNEGDTVTAGQLLLQIDPKNLETNVQNREATLSSRRSQLEQTKAQIANAEVALQQATDNLRRAEAQFNNGGLIPREQLERAQNDLKQQTTNLAVAKQSVLTQEQQVNVEVANLESARYDLKKVSIISPIDGIVTKRNIEQGETAVVGTMNNAGTVLLTIADLSIIETEIEVDETDIPDIHVGQPAKITIDALKDQTFTGHVTEVGNSPIQVSGSTTRATNFKVTVTIDGLVKGVRPGFTCTAVVTTATRQKAVAVPIQAMAVRELIVDEQGNVVRDATPARGDAGRGAGATATTTTTPSEAGRRSGPAELKPGQKRKEVEGVFIVQDGKALFMAVKTGIAGEKYFEVIEGLKDGDAVITGPFQSVRGMKDGDAVKITAATTTPATPVK